MEPLKKIDHAVRERYSTTKYTLLPHHFERRQWQSFEGVSLCYLIYKWVVAVQFVIIFTWNILDPRHFSKNNDTYWKWMLFFTNWGYTLCVVQSLIALWIVQTAWNKKASLNDGRTEIPKIYKIYSCLNSAALSVSFMITAIYWSVIYDPAEHPLDTLNLMLHAGNTLMMLIDVFMVAFPNPFGNIIYGILAGVSYILFSYIYYLCGGKNTKGEDFIYSSLDWKHPVQSLKFALLALVINSTAHCVGWSLSKLRQLLAGPRNQLNSANLTLSTEGESFTCSEGSSAAKWSFWN